MRMRVPWAPDGAQASALCPLPCPAPRATARCFSSTSTPRSPTGEAAVLAKKRGTAAHRPHRGRCCGCRHRPMRWHPAAEGTSCTTRGWARGTAGSLSRAWSRRCHRWARGGRGACSTGTHPRRIRMRDPGRHHRPLAEASASSLLPLLALLPPALTQDADVVVVEFALNDATFRVPEARAEHCLLSQALSNPHGRPRSLCLPRHCLRGSNPLPPVPLTHATACCARVQATYDSPERRAYEQVGPSLLPSAACVELKAQCTGVQSGSSAPA